MVYVEFVAEICIINPVPTLLFQVIFLSFLMNFLERFCNSLDLGLFIQMINV